MEAVRKQTFELLEGAALSSSKEDKMLKISSLVEISLFRADPSLIAEIVAGVTQFVSDRAAPVRKCALDFLEKVCCSSAGTPAMAELALDTASVLTNDETASVALKALRVASRLVKSGALKADDEAVRERLAAPITSSRPELLDAGLELNVAILLKDARDDFSAKRTRASAVTKKSCERFANNILLLNDDDAAKKELGKRSLNAAALALATCFEVLHRELVAPVIGALECKDPSLLDATVKAASTALQAAETARCVSNASATPATGAGAIAGAGARLEAALRRAGQGGAATDAIKLAHNQQQPEEEKKQQQQQPSVVVDNVDASKKRAREEEEEQEEVLAKKSTADSAKVRGMALSRLSGVALKPEVSAVLARLLRYELSAGGSVPQTLLNLALTNYAEGGFELIQRVLHDVFLLTVLDDSREAGRKQYDEMFLAFLRILRESLEDSRERWSLFTETLLAAPRLPCEETVEFLVSCCSKSEKPSSVALGLTALRDLAFNRPSIRPHCAEALFGLTWRSDVTEMVRDKAVRLASNQLGTKTALKPAVMAFARLRLRELREGTASIEEDEAKRSLSLFVALCVREPEELLPELLSAASEHAEGGLGLAVLTELERLGPAIATARGAEETLAITSKIFNGDSSFFAASVKIAVRVVEVLSNSKKKEVRAGIYAGAFALRAAALQKTTEEHCLEIVIPALNAATRTELKAIMPDLLGGNLDAEKIAQALKLAAARSLLLTPAEILVVLHELTDAELPTKRATEALGVCLSMRTVFGAPALKVALEKMTSPETALLPQMLLRTTILAVKMYPSQLSGFVADIVLLRLVHLEVWKNPALWKGFMMMCTMLGMDDNAPNCFAAALVLPQPQLAHLLKVAPKLKPALKRHAENANQQQQQQQPGATTATGANSSETTTSPPTIPEATLKTLGIILH